MRLVRLFLIWWLALLPALTAAQTRIENVATLRYAAADGTARAVRSNTVALTVARAKLASRMAVRALPPGVDGAAAQCAGTTLVAAPLDDAQVAAAAPRASIEPRAGAVIVLEAPGSNRDPALRETATVTLTGSATSQPVTLTETAADSGVFAGAIPPPGVGTLPSCRPAFVRGDRATLTFAGDDGSLLSSLAVPIDPVGLVFDATTGAAVDGAEVTLIDEAGQPAVVHGEDGVSAYPATVTSGAAASDADGRRYPVAHGGYRFPAVAAGRYRLRIAPPTGYTLSRADSSTLAALRDPAGQPFLIDPASTGGTVTLASAGPMTSDVPLDPVVTTSLLLTATISMREATPGDILEIRLHLVNRGTAASGPIRLTTSVPPGLRYRSGSWRGGTVAAAGDGRTLVASLPSLAAGDGVDLRYVATVAPGAPVGEAVATAQARGTIAVSNPASVAVRIKPLPFTDALTILGRVTAGECGLPMRARRGVAGVRLLLDDGSIAITDRDGLYHLEGVTPGRHVVALDAVGLEAIDCAADTRSAGSATSRFVEGAGGLIRRVDFQIRRAPSERLVAPPPPIAALSDAAAAGDRDWLAGQSPGIAWLFPAPDHNPRAPVTRVAIKHLPGQRVALSRDGRPVDPLSFDATDSDGHGVAVSRWVGIPLAPGVNRLVARVLGADGQVAATLERTVTVAGPSHAATFDPAHSRLVADGMTPPLLAVRVTDAGGHPVRAGTPIPFSVAAPYAAGDASTPVIGDDGLAFVALRPTGQAGAVHLALSLDDGQAVRAVAIEAWLAAAARPWTVVGFGAGSIGRDLLARHARSLTGRETGGTVVDGELSLYAKGRIKGAWLLTLAYDSARRRDPNRSVLGQVDPDRYYTVYGDDSVQGTDAATSRPLYLRLETPTFLALFGDARTGLSDTRLARYDRVVSGFKTEYRGRHWRASGFAARPDTLAGRDEIQGAGLTGPYRLRAQRVVPGSDRLRLEVRDRLRSEVIVSSTALARSLDYTIDPAAGTLRFAQPVPSRDAAGNPVFVVAEYEVEDGHARTVAGGRIVRRLGAVEIGATALADGTMGEGRVVGADARVALGAATGLRGEVAAGGWHGVGSGIAFLAEVEHRGARLDASAYVRQQTIGFGVGQQEIAEAGMSKIGGDLRWRPLDGLVVSATGWRQQMLAGSALRVAGEARVEWTRGLRTLFAGAQVADDTGLDGGDRHSRLLTLGARQVLADGAVTLEGRADLALGGAPASADFPARRQVTATWQLSPAVRLVGGYEIDLGAAYTARTLRAGVEVTPWRGGAVTAALDGQAAGEGTRRQAHYGLHQSLPLGPRWSLDATFDSARTLSGAIAAGATVNAFQPVAAAGALGSDAGDFQAATLGASYRGGRWSGRARLEHRDGATDTRWGLTFDALRAIGEGRTLAAGWRSYWTADRTGGRSASHAADVALAWRPPTSGWSILDRLTLRHETGNPIASAAGGTTLGTSLVTATPGQATSRIVNNLALDWRSTPDGRGTGIEASVSYGAKYVRGRYDDEVAAGFVDAVAIDLRRSLGHRLDIGVAASVEHGWTDRVWAWSGRPSLGFSPAGDLWVSAGYNVAGYRDRDFADDRYTRRGPYLTLRLKFDAHRLASWAGRRP